MDAGIQALLSGFLAFLVTTVVVIVTGDERRDPVPAMTIGGLTGGAVALSVWIAKNR